VAKRSDGNPLFIEELLRTWISVGTLTGEGEGWRLADPASEVPLPATVQAIYAGQIDDLPPAARQVARRASVAGRRFPERALEPLEIEKPGEAVETLVRRALLAPVPPDPLLGPAFAYRHALLRDAGYASMAKAERSRLHARLAGWLEQAAGARHGEVAELIATHYASALESAPALAREVAEGLDREAVGGLAARWFERAAEAALAVAAHDAARTLLRRALDFTADDAGGDRARLYRRLGDATAFAGDMDEGAAALKQAADLYAGVMADPIANEQRRAEARAGHAQAIAALGNVWCEQLAFREASSLADEALARIGESQDPATGRLLYLRAWATYCFQVTPSVRDDLERALAIANATNDRELELDSSALLTGTLGDLGEITRPELIDRQAQITALASDLGMWPRVPRELRMQAGMLIEDRASEARPLLERAAEIALAHGLTEDVAWIDYARSELGFVSGDWDAALEAGLRAIELGERNAYHRPVVRTWFVVVAIASARGGRDVVERAHRWFDASRDKFPPSPYAKLMHGAMDGWFGDWGLAVPPPAPLEEVLPIWDESQILPSLFSAAETLCRRWTDADRSKDVERFLDRMGRWNTHPLTTDFGRGTEALIGAQLTAATSGDPDTAAQRARTALTAYRACRAPWWIRKAIRVLGWAGASTEALRSEADEIEASLGILSGSEPARTS
jgi:tetratricopeptide (TPR) repeat protein